MAKRIRTARHYQRKDSAIRLLAEHAKPGICKDLREAFSHLGSLVSTQQALHFARAGDWHNLKRAIQWGHYREILKAPFGRIGKLRQAGAELGAKKINGTFSQARRKVRFRKEIGYNNDDMVRQGLASPGSVRYGSAWQGMEAVAKDSLGDRFSFDMFDQSTQDRLRQAQDDLIAQLEEDARDAIDAIVLNGAEEGLAAEDIVGDIRDMIGLTDTQVNAVMNYQSMLRDLDPGALERQLRNLDYDEEVQAAIDSGAVLSDVAVGKMVDDYIENYLDYRAETIAQTESVRAASAGLLDSYQQAIDRGALPSDSVTKYWLLDLDERTCQSCISVVDNNPDGVGMDEDFDSDNGPIDAPPLHVNCRCELEFVTDLDKVPEEGQ